MTTDQHKAQILARIGDCDYRIAQAAAEGRVLRGECNDWRENALERAGELALAGYYAESRRAARQFEEQSR
jgi:hypothetical protein